MEKSRQRAGSGGGKTLVESAYGAPQHLNYHTHRNTLKSLLYLSTGLLFQPKFNFHSLISSGGEFQMFCRPRCPPFADLFRYIIEYSTAGIRQKVIVPIPLRETPSVLSDTDNKYKT